MKKNLDVIHYVDFENDEIFVVLSYDCDKVVNNYLYSQEKELACTSWAHLILCARLVVKQEPFKSWIFDVFWKIAKYGQAGERFPRAQPHIPKCCT